MHERSTIVSCLVLNGSRSGYRTIIRNLVNTAFFDDNELFGQRKFIFVFQQSGWDSLGIDLDLVRRNKNHRVIVFDSFRSKWLRGLLEQFIIPFYALKFDTNNILMPATFGLFIPIRPTITFIHTNTSFNLNRELRGRGRIQQIAHNILLKITNFTSSKILFTSKQTHNEFCKFVNRSLPEFILGNGLLVPSVKTRCTELSEKLVPGQFLLSVSQIYRLKNFDRLIKAFISLKNDGLLSGIDLVIVGTIQELDYFEYLQELIAGRNDVFFFHNLPDDALNWLIHNCKAYCFYSLFEGYSLTPAEAAIRGKHIAISDIPTHREIYEQSAVYADGSDVVSISNSIITILSKADVGPPDYKSEFLSKFDFNSFMQRLVFWLE